jgi:hypothetical protein
MKKKIYLLWCVVCIWNTSFTFAAVIPESYTNDSISMEKVIEELNSEVDETQRWYVVQASKIHSDLKMIRYALMNASTVEVKLQMLLQKDAKKEELQRLWRNEISDISKIRYIKGLQIIKILYEKTLALDHHFASVSTLSEINKISNPNHYPAFEHTKNLIRQQQDKKSGFRLEGLLGENIYTSIIHSFVSLFSAQNTNAAEKQANIAKVECILDFTLRMHNDLNTIYFETRFLQKSNDNIITELQQLFVDFTKPIKYHTSLKECRDSDDWDRVREYLATYVEQLNEVLLDDEKRSKAHKMQVNLEFPIDRLLQFITQYNAFIDQGAKFYEKFGIMLHSYENEAHCSAQIPVAYKNLKLGITVAIEKFNTAYKPVEINGSKMKEVIYGLNEYD